MVRVTPPHGAWRHFSPRASRISCGGVPLGMSVASLTRTGASAPSKVIAGEARLTSPRAMARAQDVLHVDLPNRLIMFVSPYRLLEARLGTSAAFAHSTNSSSARAKSHR